MKPSEDNDDRKERQQKKNEVRQKTNRASSIRKQGKEEPQINRNWILRGGVWGCDGAINGGKDS
jgi:hypothetical protein